MPNLVFSLDMQFNHAIRGLRDFTVSLNRNTAIMAHTHWSDQLIERYKRRRRQLAQKVGSGLILILGNSESPVNYPANTYPFRQDSNMLYLTGIQKPDFALLIDADAEVEYLFGPHLTMEDLIWTGPQMDVYAAADHLGIARAHPLSEWIDFFERLPHSDRPIHYLPPYRSEHFRLLREVIGHSKRQAGEGASTALIRGIVSMRSVKDAWEIAQIEKALEVTHRIFMRLMHEAQPGVCEQWLAGIAHGIATSEGGRLAFTPIISRDGQILHNHSYANSLREGDLLLIDLGAEEPGGYASDITRTIPVSWNYTSRQADIYDIVLQAQRAALDMLAPGVRYLDVHLQAARVIAQGLKDVGLLRGPVDEIVESGAHALFFPHGLGHMMGLDVRQFGTAYLRLGKRLQSGYVLTVEPGIYFIPALIDQWRKEGKFNDFIRYDKLEEWYDFGGIRIEDDVLITESGYRILGRPIPRERHEIVSARIPAGLKQPQ